MPSDAALSPNGAAAAQQQKYIAAGDENTANTGSHAQGGDTLHAAHATHNDAHAREEGGSEHPDRYPLAQVEFDRVKTPFIIGVWILSASIAKIGKWKRLKLLIVLYTKWWRV